MPPIELVWEKAYVGQDGVEVGSYDVIVMGFKAFRLQRNDMAVVNFAESMKGGADQLIANAKYIFPDSYVPSAQQLETMFQTTDGITVGGEEAFAAADVGAESIFECLEEAGTALFEFLAV